jgi:hypothetical protein
MQWIVALIFPGQVSNEKLFLSIINIYSLMSFQHNADGKGKYALRPDSIQPLYRKFFK